MLTYHVVGWLAGGDEVLVTCYCYGVSVYWHKWQYFKLTFLLDVCMTVHEDGYVASRVVDSDSGDCS